MLSAVLPNMTIYGDTPVRPMPRITAGSLLNLILPYSALRRTAARSARAPTLERAALERQPPGYISTAAPVAEGELRGLLVRCL